MYAPRLTVALCQPYEILNIYIWHHQRYGKKCASCDTRFWSFHCLIQIKAFYQLNLRAMLTKITARREESIFSVIEMAWNWTTIKLDLVMSLYHCARWAYFGVHIDVNASTI